MGMRTRTLAGVEHTLGTSIEPQLARRQCPQPSTVDVGMRGLEQRLRGLEASHRSLFLFEEKDANGMYREKADFHLPSPGPAGA